MRMWRRSAPRAGPWAGREWTWQEEAACRGMSSDLFFPAEEERAAAARAICFGCPVRYSCLAFALERGERFGIWGGLSERERVRLSRRDREIVRWAAAQEARRSRGAA